MKMMSDVICSKLKKARIRSGVSQRQVAEVAGCTPQYVCNFERGAGAASMNLLKAYRSLGVISKNKIIKIYVEHLEGILGEKV